MLLHCRIFIKLHCCCCYFRPFKISWFHFAEKFVQDIIVFSNDCDYINFCFRGITKSSLFDTCKLNTKVKSGTSRKRYLNIHNSFVAMFYLWTQNKIFRFTPDWFSMHTFANSSSFTDILYWKLNKTLFYFISLSRII